MLIVLVPDSDSSYRTGQGCIHTQASGGIVESKDTVGQKGALDPVEGRQEESCCQTSGADEGKVA